MAQKSGKSHICNVKCRKFRDGEQDVLVFMKVLWYANRCIVTDVRINLFFCEKNDFCVKRDVSGEQEILVFLKYSGMPTRVS